MAHPRAGGPVPRGGPEHDPEMVGSWPRSGLLHAGRAPAVPPVGPGDGPRALPPPRQDEAARTGLNRRLEHWILEHRVGPLNDVFVWLTRIGSWGAVWIALALVIALLRRRAQPLVLVALADAAAEGAADLLKSAIGGR